MRDRFIVRDAASAAMLNRPRLQAVIAALIEQPCAMTALTAKSGMSYSLLSHYLKCLATQGLIRVVGKKPRAGRASLQYRATARSFFIPAAFCRELPGDLLERELRQALQRARRPDGVLLWSDGGPRMTLILDQPRSDTVELWTRLRLSPASARQLNGELTALVDRWRGYESATGASYLVHVAFAKAGSNDR